MIGEVRSKMNSRDGVMHNVKGDDLLLFKRKKKVGKR